MDTHISLIDTIAHMDTITHTHSKHTPKTHIKFLYTQLTHTNIHTHTHTHTNTQNHNAHQLVKFKQPYVKELTTE